MARLVSVSEAVQILGQGHVIGLPTETVYGLAARIDQPQALKKIFTLKQRPFFDPLIVHVDSIQRAQSLVEKWPVAAQALAETFWPGPLTLVLKKNQQVDDLITSGLETVGLRCPKNAIALKVIQDCNCALAAPSANLFGRTSPTSAQHVLNEFDSSPLGVIDDGACDIGIESTIISLRENDHGTVYYSILRTGHILEADIISLFKKKNLTFQKESPQQRMAPGQMKHHYMPTKPLVICYDLLLSDEDIKNKVLNKWSEIPSEWEGVHIHKTIPQKNNLQWSELKLPSESRMAARVLYSELRSVAAQSGDFILYRWKIPQDQSPEYPYWAAIAERLAKAATLILDGPTLY